MIRGDKRVKQFKDTKIGAKYYKPGEQVKRIYDTYKGHEREREGKVAELYEKKREDAKKRGLI